MISTQVVAVKRADGTEEELARAGFCRLDATDDGRRQLYQDGEQPRAGVVRVSAALLQRCEAAADDDARAAVARELAGPRCGFDAARARIISGRPGGARAARANRGVAGAGAERALGAEDARAPTGSSIQPSRSYVHAPFANPRAKSCWLSCAFQVLWHSRAWHTCFEAALEAGALETSEWDTPGAPKIEALVDTWREYRQTLASHAPPPPKKANRTGVDTVPDLDQADSVSPARLAEAFAPEGDRHGFGDTSDALSAVQRALDHPNVPSQARCLSDLYRIQPVPWGDGIDTARVQALLVHALATPPPRRPRRRGPARGAAAAGPVHGRRHGDAAAGRSRRGVHHRPRPRLAADARRGADRGARARLHAAARRAHRPLRAGLLLPSVATLRGIREAADKRRVPLFQRPPAPVRRRGRAAGPRANTPMRRPDGPPEMRAAVTWDER